MDWQHQLALYGAGRAAVRDLAAEARARGCSCRAGQAHVAARHARIARRVASLVPFYEYDEARFFRSDDPPEEIAARRQAGFDAAGRALPGSASPRPSSTAEASEHLRSAIHRRVSGAVPVQPPRAPAPQERAHSCARRAG